MAWHLLEPLAAAASLARTTTLYKTFACLLVMTLSAPGYSRSWVLSEKTRSEKTRYYSIERFYRAYIHTVTKRYFENPQK